MKLKSKANFHNEFEINVIRDGKVIHKGYAKNIILDRAYTKICNFSSYFTYIHFGTGTGTLSPTRTTLFSPLGYKSATIVETIKSHPISKVVKKIVINPEEYVGYSLTEVGISESTSQINTHALIKDSEGNPISIQKTDIDVIEIYATVFIELQDISTDLFFIKPPNNALLEYLVKGSSPESTLVVGSSRVKTDGKIYYKISSKEMTKTVDINNKKIIYSVRLGINEANSTITELELKDILKVNLPCNGIWNNYRISNEIVGVGDGIKTGFSATNIFTNTEDIIVKIDGVQATNYTIRSGSPKGKNILLYSNPILEEPQYLPSDMDLRALTNGITREYDKFELIPVNSGMVFPVHIVFEVPEDDKNTIVDTLKMYKPLSNATAWKNFILEISENGEDWIQHFNERYIKDMESMSFDIPPVASKYYRLKILSTNAADNWETGMGEVELIAKTDQILFSTPPPEGAIITVDYTVPFIPKTSDYVLDVSFELQFGEGE